MFVAFIVVGKLDFERLNLFRPILRRDLKVRSHILIVIITIICDLDTNTSSNSVLITQRSTVRAVKVQMTLEPSIQLSGDPVVRTFIRLVRRINIVSDRFLIPVVRDSRCDLPIGFIDICLIGFLQGTLGSCFIQVPATVFYLCFAISRTTRNRGFVSDFLAYGGRRGGRVSELILLTGSSSGELIFKTALSTHTSDRIKERFITIVAMQLFGNLDIANNGLTSCFNNVVQGVAVGNGAAVVVSHGDYPCDQVGIRVVGTTLEKKSIVLDPRCNRLFIIRPCTIIVDDVTAIRSGICFVDFNIIGQNILFAF